MIADPAQRPPLRFALLAVLLVLPALGLAALALRALALDRRAADAEVASRARDVAAAIAARLTNVIHEARPRLLLPPLLQGAELSLETAGPHFVVDREGGLVRPALGVWPPRPEPFTGRLDGEQARAWEQGQQALAEGDWRKVDELMRQVAERRDLVVLAGADERHVWEAAYLLALAAERLGDRMLADLRLWQAFHDTPPLARSAAGAPARLVAALMILGQAAGRTEALPGTWRQDPARLVDALAAVPWTPLNQRVMDELNPHLPALAAGAGVTVAALTEPLRRQEIGRRAYAALAESRTARAHSPWPDAMTLQLDRETWLALRQHLVIPGTAPAPEASADADVSNHFGLYRWATLFDEARAAAKVVDPRGVFGFAVTAAGPDFNLAQEEPAGVAARAAATVETRLPQGLAFTVAAAPVDAAAFFAARRRRERTLGAAVLGAVAVSLAAAAVTWAMLARQHRLGVEKSNLVAAVSHELRAPLASVRLLADNLAQGRVPDEARRADALRLIGRECRRLGALVDNVLDLARIARGRRRYEFGPTDVAALVRDTVAALAPAAAERGVGLRTEFAPGAEPLEAVADGRALQQALLNLLDNALKHAPAGSEVTVAVAAHRGGDAPSPRVAAAPRRAEGPGDGELGMGNGAGEGAAPKSEIENRRSKIYAASGDEASPAPCCDGASQPRGGFTLTVTDAGPGIPAGERERVFRPFQRVGGELRRETTGVGIGLAIVRHIVAAHGGRVWIEDAVPRGTRVVMRMSRARNNHE